MIPMVEMAGLDRIKYINDILYVYNNENPISEFRIDESEQLRENEYMRKNIPIYEKLI